MSLVSGRIILAAAKLALFLAFVSGSWQSPNAFPQLFVPWSIFALPLWLAWLRAPIPLILSAFAIRHVWRGTAKPIAA
jgi:hypothetical protein